MTSARRAALAWFHERGEVRGGLWRYDDAPSPVMVDRMVRDGQLSRGIGKRCYSLTDKGRRMLNGDDK